MPKTLQEYAEWLDHRELIWPAAPPVRGARAEPSIKPLPGIRAVTWNLYGTLLHISDGEFLIDHPDRFRMQIALEKTIEEFNMWHSMHRKPGAPWEGMHQQYMRFVEEQQMRGTGRTGDVPEVDLVDVWRKLVAQLQQKDYQYDTSFFGDADELAEKIAYFFHRSLQGLEAASHALDALTSVAATGRVQGVLANGQAFTLTQLLRALADGVTLPSLGELLAADCVVLSYQERCRSPSRSLYRSSLKRLEARGIAPHEVLHVSTRVRDDLAVAKQAGMRTALYTGDRLSLRASQSELRDRELKPDRLLTDLAQIREIIST